MKKALCIAIILLCGVLSSYAEQNSDAGKTFEDLKITPELIFVKAAKADVGMIIPTGLDMYFIDNGMYPSAQEGLGALVVKPDSAKNWNGPYLRNEKNLIDPWGHPYVYQYPLSANEDEFIIYSLGPDGQEGTKDDIVSKSSVTGNDSTQDQAS